MADDLVVAYVETSRQLRARLLAIIQRLWLNLGDYRDADIARFADAAIPIADGAQLQMGRLTDAYLTRLVASDVTIAAEELTTAALRGVDAETVFSRPGITVWTALSSGFDFEAARAQGLRRAESIVTTNLQLARTHAAQAVISNTPAHVVGYRRVLTGSTSCGLCVVASTQRYHRKALMPIHPGCDCAVAPIIGHDDPGRIINGDRLAQAKTELADRFGKLGTPAQLRDQLVVHEHGELGPVLAVKGQNFIGPDDF